MKGAAGRPFPLRSAAGRCVAVAAQPDLAQPADPLHDVLLLRLGAERLLHGVEALPALHALDPGELGLACPRIPRAAEHQQGEGPSPFFTFADPVALRRRTGDAPPRLDDAEELTRTHMATVRRIVDGDHVGPVVHGLALWHVLGDAVALSVGALVGLLG